MFMLAAEHQDLKGQFQTSNFLYHSSLFPNRVTQVHIISGATSDTIHPMLQFSQKNKSYYTAPLTTRKLYIFNITTAILWAN